jgi:hypothetical protein
MTSVQNVFVFGEGAAGAMGEIERRKFTAEEGVSICVVHNPTRTINNSVPMPCRII